MKIDTIEIESDGFIWTLPNNDTLTNQHSAAGTSHEPHIKSFIQQYLNEGDIAIDIGACYGLHSLEMARKVGMMGKVYSFEPSYEMYNILRTNLQRNGLFNTSVLNLALGDVEMDVAMYNAYDSDTTNYGDSFISWKYKENNATDDCKQPEMIRKGGKSLPLNKTMALCKTLDSMTFEHPVKLVKIDVQGFELMVLQGGKEFITKHRPVFIIELEESCMNFHGYGTKEIIKYLRSIRYEVLFLYHSYPCDHVCVPFEKLYRFYVHFKGKIVPHTENNPINNNVHNGVHKKLCLL